MFKWKQFLLKYIQNYFMIPKAFFKKVGIRKIDAALKSQNQLPKSFVQDNHSRSKKGTLRGLQISIRS